MKRTLDLFLVLLFAFVFAIPMLILAIAQKCLLGSPILFHQKRIGQHGRPFYIHKFRTMKLGEESDQKRITRWGRFLRSTSLDELPELWNVFIGEMSFVGPRPLPTSYKDRYSPEQNRRHQALPGITGWAQVNGRNALSWKEKFNLDVYYVHHQSFWLDLKILLMTVVKVFKSEGVNANEKTTMQPFNGNN